MKSFSYYLTFALLLSFFGTSVQGLQAQRTKHHNNQKEEVQKKRKPVTTYPGGKCPEGETRTEVTSQKGAWKFTGMAFLITGTGEDIDTFDIVEQIDLALNSNYNGDLAPAIIYGQSIISTYFNIYFFFEREVKESTKTWICTNGAWVFKGTTVKTITQKDNTFQGPFMWTDINPIRLQKMRTKAVVNKAADN